MRPEGFNHSHKTEGPKTIRVAFYDRISKDKSDQKTENQLEDLRAFVERKCGNGWVLEERYVDRRTGKTADRSAFRKLFEDACPSANSAESTAQGRQSGKVLAPSSALNQ
jgi:hypothetical protein